MDYGLLPMGVIFLSYRRDASAGYTGRLYDRLAGKYGKRNVFMDVDAIPANRERRVILCCHTQP